MPGFLERLDAFQQRHAAVGFPLAVYKKFGDDQAGNLAALIAYYAFLSIFPLLLALTTILGFVLAGDPSLQHQVFSSALGTFPIIGQHSRIKPLTGNVASLVIGLALAIWSGLAVAQTAQTAFNTVYDVPRVDRPGFLPRLLRSVELTTVVGFGLIVTTLLQGAVSGSGSYGLNLGVGLQIIAAVVGIALNTLIFTFAFRRLTAYEMGFRAVLPGALGTAIGWFVLQKVGTYLVNSKIKGAQGTYGTFAVVIGLLAWFYLLAQLTLYCAELNVVLTRRLWPRGLRAFFTGEATTDADRRAYGAYPQQERQVHNIDVDVHVDESTNQ